MKHQISWVNDLVSLAENPKRGQGSDSFVDSLNTIIEEANPDQKQILEAQKTVGNDLLARIKSKKDVGQHEHRLMELLCILSSKLDDPYVRDVVEVFAAIIDHGLSHNKPKTIRAAFSALNVDYFDANQHRSEFVEQTAHSLVPLRKVLTRQDCKVKLSSAGMVMLGRSFGRLLCRDNYAEHMLTSDNRYAVATIMSVAMIGFNDIKEKTIDTDIFDFVEALIQRNESAREGFSMWGHPFLEAIKNHDDDHRIARFIEIFGETVLSQKTPSGQPENVLLIGNRHNDYMGFNAENAVPKALAYYAKNNAEHIGAVLNMAIGEIKAKASTIDWKSTHKPTLQRQNLENYFKTVRIVIEATAELSQHQLMLDALSDFDAWLDIDGNETIKQQSKLGFLSGNLAHVIEKKVMTTAERGIPRRRAPKVQKPKL